MRHIGYYQDTAGQDKCIACPSGSYNPLMQMGSITNCLQCGYGMYQDEEGKDSCKLCSLGKYQDQFGHE